MTRELAETPGDQSSNFAFVSFLPKKAKEFADPIVNILHELAVTLAIVPNMGTSQTGTMLDKSTVYDRQKY
jgi:hypothetical protein